MHRATLLATLLLGIGLPPSCLLEEFTNDGAFCSERATCPPNQTCSPDGYCLIPCPVKDCVGDDCGCEPRVTDHEIPRVCRADGLCHLACTASGPTCPESYFCDALTSECVQPCEVIGDYCWNGATCVATQDTGGSARLVCRAP